MSCLYCIQILIVRELGFDAARLATGVSFNVKVFDDDGEGPDGWINLTDDTEPMKTLCFK